MTDNPSASTEAPADERDESVAGTQGEQNPSQETLHGDESAKNQPRYHPPRQDSFDWRGWLLVGSIVVSFFVIPGAILYLPYAQDLIAASGLAWRQAYLVLPMIPAVLLGAIAIWTAVSSRSPSE
jgi:hypothetical protein